MINTAEYKKWIINSDIASRLNSHNSRDIPEIISVHINSNYSLNIIRAVYVLQLLFNRKPSLIKTNKSIAGFNLREGTITSYKLSLNKRELDSFISVLSNVVIPRLKSNDSKFEVIINSDGNINIGIENIKIFPQIEFEYDKIASNIGMNISIKTSSSNILYIKSLISYLHLVV